MFQCEAPVEDSYNYRWKNLMICAEDGCKKMIM